MPISPLPLLATPLKLFLVLLLLGCGRAEGPARVHYSVEGLGELDAEVWEGGEASSNKSLELEADIILNSFSSETCFSKEVTYLQFNEGFAFRSPSGDLCKISSFELNFESLAEALEGVDLAEILGDEILPGEAFALSGDMRIDFWPLGKEDEPDANEVQTEVLPIKGLFRVLSFQPQRGQMQVSSLSRNKRHFESFADQAFMSGKILLQEVSTACGNIRIVGRYDFYLIQNFETV